jgi:shikimate dehydrogenase
VLGHPVDHSLSPVLHRAAYADLGLDWSYDRLDVTEGDLAGFLAALDPTWAGLSLTMPLKTVVLELLDERDAWVEVTGAANTVVLDRGVRRGHNTDVVGIVRALEEAGLGERGHGTILGGGATARSALAALSRLGATAAAVVARRPDAAEDLREVAASLGVELVVAGWDAAQDHLGAPIVISTVPSGAADRLAALVPAAPGVLLDVVYEPWPTPLAARWSAHGGRVASGLAMLLHQAVAQVELMTGRRPEVEPMRRALAEAVLAR